MSRSRHSGAALLQGGRTKPRGKGSRSGNVSREMSKASMAESDTGTDGGGGGGFKRKGLQRLPLSSAGGAPSISSSRQVSLALLMRVAMSTACCWHSHLHAAWRQKEVLVRGGKGIQ